MGAAGSVRDVVRLPAEIRLALTQQGDIGTAVPPEQSPNPMTEPVWRDPAVPCTSATTKVNHSTRMTKLYDQAEEEQQEPDLDTLTIEQLQRTKLISEIEKLREETDELADRREASSTSQYNNRVIHFVDVVEWKSTRAAITQLAEMVRASEDPIEIIFHSPGGDVFSGNALFDYIQMVRETGVKVTTVALGGAFSMAGILLQAGDHRVMTPNSWLMIHEVGSGLSYGTTSSFKDEVELLSRLEKAGNAILASRSTLTVKEIEDRCHRKNWWLNAEEALKFGFVDEIRPLPAPTPITASKKRTRRTKDAA